MAAIRHHHHQSRTGIMTSHTHTSLNFSYQKITRIDLYSFAEDFFYDRIVLYFWSVIVQIKIFYEYPFNLHCSHKAFQLY